jgi:hypothetical protein
MAAVTHGSVPGHHMGDDPSPSDASSLGGGCDASDQRATIGEMRRGSIAALAVVIPLTACGSASAGSHTVSRTGSPLTGARVSSEQQAAQATSGRPAGGRRAGSGSRWPRVSVVSRLSTAHLLRQHRWHRSRPRGRSVPGHEQVRGVVHGDAVCRSRDVFLTRAATPDTAGEVRSVDARVLGVPARPMARPRAARAQPTFCPSWVFRTRLE